MQHYMKILGLEVEDTVTGLKGVAESISFDLYGCVQVVVRPSVDQKDGSFREGRYMDFSRLKVTGKKPVMKVPTFEEAKAPAPGPASKPLRP